MMEDICLMNFKGKFNFRFHPSFSDLPADKVNAEFFRALKNDDIDTLADAITAYPDAVKWTEDIAKNSDTLKWIGDASQPEPMTDSMHFQAMGMSVLECAIQYKAKACFHLLLTKRSNPNAVISFSPEENMRNKERIIFDAIRSGDPDFVTDLILAGADVTTPAICYETRNNPRGGTYQHCLGSMTPLQFALYAEEAYNLMSKRSCREITRLLQISTRADDIHPPVM